MAENIHDSYGDAWSRLQRGWRDQGAEAFRRAYGQTLLDLTEQFQQGCTRLEELTARLDRELSAIEGRPYD